MSSTSSTIRMSGMVSGLDTESLVAQLVSAQKLKDKKTTDQKTILEWKQEKWKDLNTKLYKLYTDDLSKLRLQGSYTSKKVSSSNDSLITAAGTASVSEGTHTVEVSKLASAQFVTGGVIKYDADGSTSTADVLASGTTTLKSLGMSVGQKITITANGSTSQELTVTADTTIADFVAFAKSDGLGLNASYDATQGRLYINSKSSGDAGKFQITASDVSTASPAATADEILAHLGLDAMDTDGAVIDTTTGKQLSVVVPTSKSVIKYNNVDYTSDSNTITVNGLTLTAKGLTTDKVSINVSNDVDTTYNMVKKFVTDYNAILKEMNTLYYADSASDYAPLSDDQKESMSDDQITQWEDKIKGAMLRRDSTLGSIIDSMKSAIMGNVSIDGKTYALSNYGITTSEDYTEKGLLHIYGNQDDSTYSTKDDKLKTALQEDPDTVVKVLSGLSTQLYDAMTKKMSSIANVRSAYTFYNDKEMATELTDLKKKISDQEDKLTDMEDRYYKQFSAMETALAKLQQQSSSLSGMLGTSS